MPEDRERPNISVGQDMIEMTVQGGGIGIGKVSGGTPDRLPEAIDALREILRRLQDEGLVDEQGEPVDEAAVQAEAARHRGVFRRILGTMNRSAGEAMLASVGGGAAATVVETLVSGA
ncbi:hypothetical protein GCM10010191_86150 [Actinomadura vinacea]|uniref:Uncharacterized protein n=1 Tax=Actinomadura vinacea TaxID=115336 RepID=A0ABN3KAA5_9ACTN